jgi:pimeloyl-ACP methyl ester carboxylesterase
MSRAIEGAGVALVYEERGQGETVLLIHGIASDALALAPLAEALAGTARAVAYDRRGYGASGAPEPYVATTVHEQAQDAAALLHALGNGPAVLAGVGFGALIALDLLKRHPELVRAAVLVDPPLFAFVPEATAALGAERALLSEALRAGGPEAAVAAWLGEDAEPEALARARAAHRAFFADVAGVTSWPVTRGELRALDVPVVVLVRPQAPAHVGAAAGALAGLLPAARLEQGEDVAAAVRSLL